MKAENSQASDGRLPIKSPLEAVRSGGNQPTEEESIMETPTQTAPPAVYVNFLRVGMQPSEFYLALGQLSQQDSTTAHLLSAFIATPMHAKAMYETLGEAIHRYEARFGAIPAAEPPHVAAAGGSAGRSDDGKKA